MKYDFVPKLMWKIFKGTFENALSKELELQNAKSIMKMAHKDYKKILAEVDEFEKGSRFLFNILSGAMFTAILMNLPTKYSVEQIRRYFKSAMSNNLCIKIFAKKRKAYTVKGRVKLKQQAEKSMQTTNPYEWKYSIEDGETINQYTALFYTCGICYLMKKWGYGEYIPAMCALDYDMAEMNHTVFTREYTLADGGKYCDCHYNYKGKVKNFL